jgi:hypothetical protein
MNSLRRYVHRAPRYVLRPNDKHMVRYLPEQLRGPMAVHKTKMINVSETGMAIMVDSQVAPHIGERMKVELPVPGGEQIAWWARVVRTELVEASWWANEIEDHHDQIVVGLRFEELPSGHRKAIRRGLEARFIEDVRERRRQKLLFLYASMLENSGKLLLWAACIIAAALILYLLSRPSANYDPEHGAPWGERFQFFDWQKNK